MCLQVQHRVPPQFNISLNPFVHFYALMIAGTSVTQVLHEKHFLVHSQVHFLVHLYIDLKVHL